MYYILAVLISLGIGIGLGYAFRGKENKALKAALSLYEGIDAKIDAKVQAFLKAL